MSCNSLSGVTEDTDASRPRSSRESVLRSRYAGPSGGPSSRAHVARFFGVQTLISRMTPAIPSASGTGRHGTEQVRSTDSRSYVLCVACCWRRESAKEKNFAIPTQGDRRRREARAPQRALLDGTGRRPRDRDDSGASVALAECVANERDADSPVASPSSTGGRTVASWTLGGPTR